MSDASHLDDLAKRFRAQMPVAARWAYLDHAAVSPLPEPARAAIESWARQAAEEGVTAWAGWTRRLEEVRAAAARLIAAAPDEIALVRNTTEGVNLVAEGFPWNAGDNVVTLDDEFPTNAYPWLHLADRGVETRRVPTDDGRVDLDRIDGACDGRTRIVSVSWVGFSSGYRNDLASLAEIAHRHGALLFVDAIQGLGLFPLDVGRMGVDFLAADGHKWLLGPEGAGLFYVRREHLERLRPLGVGWNSVVHWNDYGRIELKFKPSASRYEGGSQNMPGLLGLGASLALLLEMGIDNLARRVLHTTDTACRLLEEAGARIRSHRQGEHRSGIVSFDLPGRNPQQVRKAALDAGVVLSCRLNRLRISPHAYNSQEDLDRLLEAMGR